MSLTQTFLGASRFEPTNEHSETGSGEKSDDIRTAQEKHRPG